jgi:general stress protein 26
MATDPADHVWSMMEDLTFCMLANWDGQKLHARPMGAFVRRNENAIYFFTDANAEKDREIARYPRVCLAFGDPGKQDYVSVSGAATITNDRAKIKELWSIPAKAWWKSPDEPNIRLIKVIPEQAEFWDSPGNMVSNLKIALAAVTGDTPKKVGDHAKARL